MMTISLFDDGLARKDAGIDRVKENNAQWIKEARAVAMEILSIKGEICSDDVHEAFPPPADAHPNVMGALMRDLGLKAVGFRPTTRPSGHGRVIRVYRKKEQQ